MRSRHNKFRGNTRLAILLGSILCIVVLSGGIIWVAQVKPINQATKDWLDIVSAIGQAAGVVALIGLVYEIYQREEENKKQRTPYIEVGPIQIIQNPPSGAIICLSETSERDLPPKESLPIDDDYREMWLLLDNRSQEPKAYLKIEVTNKQSGIEANAQGFRMRLELDFASSENQFGKSSTKRFWCPVVTTPVDAGKTLFIFVRCGKMANGNTYIKGRILDYECRNLRGDKFVGSNIGFHPVPIHPQLIIRVVEISATPIE